jgi:hypothetical protein
MSDSEQIEIARYHQEIVADVRHLLDKYLRILEWDVPDVEEQGGRDLVLRAVKAALAEVEAGQG